jgi:hypothetical protein
MRPPRRNSTSADYRDQPTYWFALLEIARDVGDFEQAAEAQRQLKRLGVRVHYERRIPVPVAGGATRA